MRRQKEKESFLPLWAWVVIGVTLLVVAFFTVGPADAMNNLLCPTGEVVTESEEYRLDNGEHGTSYVIYCADGDQRRKINDDIAIAHIVLLVFAMVVPMLAVTIGGLQVRKKRKSRS